MRLPRSTHTDQPWRIHAFTRDFRVQDVWSFRTPGAGPDDFPVMLTALRTAAGSAQRPGLPRLLFAVRWKLGAAFGWDTPETGLGQRVPPLRERLPPDLRATTDGTTPEGDRFAPVYALENECARELANKTMHGVVHWGWVPSAGDDHELRMAVLVKANGRLGRLYMALIAPFRHLIVYPALTRRVERAWRDRSAALPEGADPRR